MKISSWASVIKNFLPLRWKQTSIRGWLKEHLTTKVENKPMWCLWADVSGLSLLTLNYQQGRSLRTVLVWLSGLSRGHLRGGHLSRKPPEQEVTWALLSFQWLTRTAIHVLNIDTANADWPAQSDQGLRHTPYRMTDAAISWSQFWFPCHKHRKFSCGNFNRKIK